MPRLVPSVLIFLVLGCGTTGRVPGDDVPGIAGRDCRYRSLQVDPDGGGWWTRLRGEPAQPLTLSIRYGRTGELVWVRPLGIPTAEGERWAERVEAVAAGAEAPRTDMRLRLEPGEPPVPLPAVTCDVEIPRGEPFFLVSAPSGALTRVPVSTTPIRFTLRVSVGPDGEPVDARVTGGAAGTAEYERLLVENALRRRYLPALHDGFPVPGSYSVETAIRTRVR